MPDCEERLRPGWKLSSDFVLPLHTPSSAHTGTVTDSLSSFLPLNCMLSITHTLPSFAFFCSASPSIAFCLGDPPPFLYSMHPSTILHSLNSLHSHLLSNVSVLFSFFSPISCFSYAFLSFAHSFRYIVLHLHAPCVFHVNGTTVSSAFRCCNTMFIQHTPPTEDSQYAA